MIPIRATYRLQLNKDFTFRNASDLVPYLARLGISHAYLSPILKAQPGSTHGYDTVDHTVINPELGDIADFRALVRALRSQDMGIILDFVPNHMGVGGADNALWLDVLRHGPASAYADWFDIDWQPPRADLCHKLLVPFLGASYAETLAAGDIRLKADGARLAIWAYEKEKLPIRPEDERALLQRYGDPHAAVAALNGTPGHGGSWFALDGLIATQHWRPAHFLAAPDEINYRRFFINSELAGIRIDRPEVFDQAHRLIFSLVDEGLVDGLRMDHVDGLLDPKAYLQQVRDAAPRPIYLIVEKILAPHEPLRRDWPVDGTTGYEVGVKLTRVLIDPAGEEPLNRIYADFVGPTTDPRTEAYRCKLRVMDNELAAELATLARHLAALAWSQPATGDLTENGLRKATREVIGQLDVYRSYIDADGIVPRDARDLRLAIGRARRARPHFGPALFDFVSALLLGELSNAYDPKLVADALGRFQQYTGPVMAKGLEDTALYRYNRLVALNEVGAHPDRFSISLASFHDANRRRLIEHPDSMVTTSTHDTKRGEDIRALIGALSDAPHVWSATVSTWRQALGSVADPIHPNDLYLFAQLLHGGWPISGQPHDLAGRLKAAMVKSLREARERSDWGVANTGYEGQMETFVDSALSNNAAMQEFLQQRAPLAEIGRRKALVQLVLKLTIPGVPDIYRGAEDWEQSFVDPDNRRPVDFAALARRFDNPQGSDDEKLRLTGALLQLRRTRPALFARGLYEPLDQGNSVLAFRRRHGDDEMIVLTALSSHPDLPLIGAFSGEEWQSHLAVGPAAVLTRRLL